MTDNPYKPGAAHAPPYLAGRAIERHEFSRLLKQTTILENLLLTGIRGIGKTVLMREVLRKDAVASGWIWVGSDVSEVVSVSENHLARRLLTDLNIFSSDWTYITNERHPVGFTGKSKRQTIRFDYQTMMTLFEHEPGLTLDKIKHILLTAWELMQKHMPDKKGIIFAWDEAQNFADRSENDEYPLGVLLDVFSSLQSQGVPFMLLLSGLPTLLPKLVESRTYAERMFRVMTLHNLNSEDSHAAIVNPLEKESQRIKLFFTSQSKAIHKITNGYPYFIQFWCRELYDYIIDSQQLTKKKSKSSANEIVHILARIIHKLDMDFFDTRWARLTDRQRDLLTVIAHIKSRDDEFTVQEIVAQSKSIGDVFSGSHVNQMLGVLFAKGMVFKSRHGKYILAIPLLNEYIRRRMDIETAPKMP